jgi:hypothetical protein
MIGRSSLETFATQRLFTTILSDEILNDTDVDTGQRDERDEIDDRNIDIDTCVFVDPFANFCQLTSFEIGTIALLEPVRNTIDNGEYIDGKNRCGCSSSSQNSIGAQWKFD